MAPKKAAKKTAKKAAKKHAMPKPAHDARRTFEHLGRVQALSPLTTSESETILFLTKLADGAFRTGQYKESADLLRGAEHLSFAILHAGSTETVTPDLRAAITEEFEHLTLRMSHHASEHPAPKMLLQLRTRLHQEAKSALRRGSFRAALEFARGTEALAHVHLPEAEALPSSTPSKRLRS